MSDLTCRILGFENLSGWAADDHAAALAVFQASADALPQTEWGEIAALTRIAGDPQAFFERHFLPVLVEDGKPMLFTGYYEPEIPAALAPDDAYRFPVHTLPPELTADAPWLTRQQIAESGILANRGLEIAWLADPMDVYFLQIQGSGRLILPDGQVLRVGFAGKNGHPYASIAAKLIARGEMEPHQASMQRIRDWVTQHPDQLNDLLWTNQSYVFFRPLHDLPPESGPLGAMDLPVTALRSIAVDPEFVPLGAPVWIEMNGSPPIHRLMVAQDIGSAIKGAQRADIYFGTGDQAGAAAGKIRNSGRMVVLFPRQVARNLCARPGTLR